MPASNNGDITLKVGLDTTNAYKAAQELEEEVVKIFETDTSDNAKLEQLRTQLKQNVQQAQQLRTKLDELGEANIPTEEYKEIEGFIKDTKSELDKLLEQQQEFQSIGISSGGAWDALQSQITEAQNTIIYAKQDLQDLVTEGKAFTLGTDPNQVLKIEQQLDGVNDKTKLFLLKYKNANNELNKQPSTLQKIKANITKVASSASSINKHFSKTPSILKNIKTGTNHVLKNILKWGLGIVSVTVLARKLREAITAGLENLSTSMPNNALSKQIETLKNSLTQLKNAWTAAFSPILSVVLPILQRLIDGLIKAASYVGQFFAALTGKNSVLKATKVVGGLNKGLDKTAKKADKAANSLGKFDELNVITTKEEDAEDKSGGAGGVAPMFTTESVSDTVKDFVDKLKEMWNKADFTELGKELGEKLKTMLYNIDWGPIQEAASKVGKSIATFINGFVEVPNLGYDIGHTIAEALNTALSFIQSFLDNLHAISVGDFFGEMVMGFFRDADWNAIGNTISLGVSKIIEFFVGFIQSVDFGVLGDAIAQMFIGIDWGRLCTDVGLLLLGVLKGAVQLLYGLVGGLFDIIADIFDTLGLDCVAGFFRGMSDNLQQARQWIQEWFQKIVQTVKDFLGIHSPSTVFSDIGIMVVQGLINGIKSIISTVAKIFTAAWESIKVKTTAAFQEVHNNIVNKITTIKTAISNVLSSIKSTWTSMWNSLKTVVTSVFSGIWGSIRGTINSILGGIQTMANGIVVGINKVIRTLNNLRFTIPSWVPGYGGNSLGFNIPTMSQISLPRLAQGAVIPPNREFMAVLGDQKHGTNIEAPLDTMVEAFNKASGNRSEEEIRLLTEQNELLRALLQKEWGPTDSQMFTSVRNSARIFTKSTGLAAF